MDTKKLTDKEEEVMRIFWERGPITVREAVEAFPEPRPHFNTVSTYVHILETKGYLQREKRPGAMVYAPAIPIERYQKASVKVMLKRLFNGNSRSLVSALVEEEEISVDELKELIEIVSRQKL
ncbi:MAG: BlaI/MecI/CopY family transcriptional regulator [Bacteroidales bacterium]|nr:BlaI/MecI/CopY family transcriptional regulator [Bacteroidales bacterium]